MLRHRSVTAKLFPILTTEEKQQTGEYIKCHAGISAIKKYDLAREKWLRKSPLQTKVTCTSICRSEAACDVVTWGDSLPQWNSEYKGPQQ